MPAFFPESTFVSRFLSCDSLCPHAISRSHNSPYRRSRGILEANAFGTPLNGTGEGCFPVKRTSELTPREREVLEFIRLFYQAHGFPPTVRQIAEGMGLSSTASAHYYLKRLEHKGAIQRHPKMSRSLKLQDLPSQNAANTFSAINEAEEVREVPLLGHTPAGNPREALENPEGSMYAPASFTGQRSSENPLFYLRVRGDSMTGAGIFDGDYVLIRRQDTAEEGEIVLALTSDGEATIKRLRFQGKQAVLVAENPEYPPLTDLEFRILGKVVGVFRVLS